MLITETQSYQVVKEEGRVLRVVGHVFSVRKNVAKVSAGGGRGNTGRLGRRSGTAVIGG